MRRPSDSFPLPYTLLLVFLGGASGVLARAGISAVIPAIQDTAVGTMLINAVGAGALGYLLQRILPRPGRDETARGHGIRLLCGTGFLGGFTTFSALAVDTLILLEAEKFMSAALYALGTLVLGALAAALGMYLAERTRPHPVTDAGVADR